ncbi:MAG: glycosyltransferase family 2 protein, partial [Bacteroidales bacterium]|nr:glycosyltransferase family 2 protein [Bacteroidales bacterium]
MVSKKPTALMTARQIDYTVIIPHYNIPELLGRCLRSIPEQDNVQVIVVDDCSPDAENYSERIPELSRCNVEFCSTLRGGSAGRARNVGIRRAKGKWLTFLDADDLFSDGIADIMEENKNRQVDVMFFRTKAVLSDDLSRPSERNTTDRLFNYYFRDGVETYLRYEFEPPWGKFVRRSLVEKHNMLFEEIRYSNDAYFNNCIGVY